MEECIDTVVAEGGVTQKAAAGSRSSEAEGDLLVSEVGIHQKDTEKDQNYFGHVKAPQKRRAVIRARLAETQDHVSAPPTDKSNGAEHLRRRTRRTWRLSSVPSAVSEPRWAWQMCDQKCGAKGFKFFGCAAAVSEKGGAAHTVNSRKKCYNEWRVKQDEAEVAASKWRALIEQKASRGKLWAAFGVDQFLRRMCGNVPPSKKAWSSSVLTDAENAKQFGTDGRWQHEKLYKEELELLRHSTDLYFG